MNRPVNNNVVLFEAEAVKAWFKKNRKDVQPGVLDDLLNNPGIMLVAAAAYAAGYEKSRERGGYAPSIQELDDEAALALVAIKAKETVKS